MYDAIVVGARCAGAPTAMLLARAGHRVLLVDRATFPSDKPMSTHLVHPPAILRLREWGLLDKVVASGCPPIHDYGFAEGPLDFMAPLPPIEDVGVAYAPRRHVLDPILLQGALEAGVEFAEGVSVRELVWDDDRVAGVRIRDARGTGELRSKIVVGADGTNSLVARSVGAPDYRARAPLTQGLWTYWSGLPVPNVPTFRANGVYVFAWPTNDGQTLVGVAWRAGEFPPQEPEEAYFTALHAVAPAFAEQVRAAERAERWIRGSIPNFFRKPYGPGWALVGDSSYSKDPCTAQGITDALRDSQSLASAIDEGLSGRRRMAEALAGHQRGRDAHAIPYYEYTCDFATLDPYPPEVLELLRLAAERDVSVASGLVGMFAQTVSPADFFSSAGMRNLFSTLGRPRHLSMKMRLVQSLLVGPGGRSRTLGHLAERLIAPKLGAMRQFLHPAPGPALQLADPPLRPPS